MRLFIAINLSENIKDELGKTITRLKAETRRGSFTRRDNFHITMLFLGEVDTSKVNNIKQAMEDVQATPFEINLSSLGYFKRNEGDIFWIGVHKNEVLNDIYEQLYSRLTQVGFSLEARQFKPHLTIGRRVIANHGFDSSSFSQSIPSMKMTINKISLMKSERINEKLTYSEIYARDL